MNPEITNATSGERASKCNRSRDRTEMSRNLLKKKKNEIRLYVVFHVIDAESLWSTGAVYISNTIARIFHPSRALGRYSRSANEVTKLPHYHIRYTFLFVRASYWRLIDGRIYIYIYITSFSRLICGDTIARCGTRSSLAQRLRNFCAEIVSRATTLQRVSPQIY